jgi:hypothetical protein
MSISGVFQGSEKIGRGTTFCLILIVALTCFLSFYPHFEYPYLLHVDEWFHVARAKQVVLNANVDWYTGERFALGMERAWHLMLASIQFLFKPLVTHWIFIPTVLHVAAVLTVFYFVFKLFGKKEALISSLLIALFPSNVTMGGPVFLMPINLSLIFIPLALVFAFGFMKTMYSYFFLFVITTFLLYAHPPTAIVLLLILGFYVLLNLFSKKGECKRKAKILLIVVVFSFLLSLPNYLPEMQRRGFESITFNFWVYLERIPFIYGVVPTVFFIVGFYFLFKGWEKETMCLLFTSLFLMLNIFFFSMSGLSYFMPYQRTHVPLFLLMSIVASRGYTKLLEFKRPWVNLGLTLLILCLIVTTSMAVYRNVNVSYYHVIDSDDYENFLWLKENSLENATVLLDPWKARALPPVAERRVYAVVPFGPVEKQMRLVNNATVFLAENCINTSFLMENNIQVVYNRIGCENPDLIEIKDGIYLLE